MGGFGRTEGKELRFDLTDMRLFLTVVEQGSLTKGAESMNLALAWLLLLFGACLWCRELGQVGRQRLAQPRRGELREAPDHPLDVSEGRSERPPNRRQRDRYDVRVERDEAR
jgi:hypothetical protein